MNSSGDLEATKSDDGWEFPTIVKFKARGWETHCAAAEELPKKFKGFHNWPWKRPGVPETVVQSTEAISWKIIRNHMFFGSAVLKKFWVKPSKKGPRGFKIEALRLQHRTPETPKSRPGASKIEAGALQDAISKRRLT